MQINIFSFFQILSCLIPLCSSDVGPMVHFRRQIGQTNRQLSIDTLKYSGVDMG
jgi:hypothetical protein